jgi:hypothetical protein
VPNLRLSIACPENATAEQGHSIAWIEPEANPDATAQWANKRRLEGALSTCDIGRLLQRLGASDRLDVGTVDAEVAELTIVKSTKLTDGLLVLSELCEFLADVHLVSLSI